MIEYKINLIGISLLIQTAVKGLVIFGTVTNYSCKGYFGKPEGEVSLLIKIKEILLDYGPAIEFTTR